MRPRRTTPMASRGRDCAGRARGSRRWWWLAHRSAAQTPAAGGPSVDPLVGTAASRDRSVSVTWRFQTDGSRVAYASASRLWIRRMGQKEAVAIEVDARQILSFPQTANGWVFSAGSRGLRKVPALGGTPVPIVTTSERPGGGTWRADGTIVFATSEGLYQVSENGGEPRLLVKPDPRRKERAYAWPQFMPDGRSVLFTIVPEDSIDGAQIALLDMKTLETRVVLKGGSAARYASTGHLVYASGQTLKAIAFDPDTQQTRGDPVSLPDIEIANSARQRRRRICRVRDGHAPLYHAQRAWPAAADAVVGRPSGKGRTAGARAGPVRLPAHLAGRHPRGPRHSRRQSGYLDLEPPTAEPDAVDRRSDRGSGAGVEPGRPPRVLRIGPDRELRRATRKPRTGPPRHEWSSPVRAPSCPQSFTPDGTRLLVIENFKDLSVLNLARPDRLEPLLHRRIQPLARRGVPGRQLDRLRIQRIGESGRNLPAPVSQRQRATGEGLHRWRALSAVGTEGQRRVVLLSISTAA